MLTVEKLASFGADTAAGLARCMNNEAFYLRLVNTELGDANFGKLQDALSSGRAVARGKHDRDPCPVRVARAA